MTRRVLFREVNARIREINEGFGVGISTYHLLCECARESCVERLEVPVPVFADAQRDDDAFVVVPAHVHAGERVTAGNGRYAIVKAAQAHAA